MDRRQVILAGGAALMPGAAFAAVDAGIVERAVGLARAGTPQRDLVAAARVFVGDVVRTGPDSLLAMMLGGQTHVFMGPETELTIDRYTAEAGGELVLGQGALLFDRDEAAEKSPVSLSTAFGLIAVRGTQFFAGPSNGKFGVFVGRGEVRFAAVGAEVVLTAGFGSEVAVAGDAPSPPAQWGQARIDVAFALVGAT
jgi:ferric-dicitrate binding protein FerR (iron transport regulator)